MNPLVSIVIPVYNREKYISEAIESAINQTYKNIEIVVVDNCSTDHTWDILKNYAEKDERIRIFKNDTNIGPVLNWQECFHKAKGEYIKILWSDDWMSLDFIEKACEVLKSDVAFVISWQQIMKDNHLIKSISYVKSTYKSSYYIRNVLYISKENFPLSPGCALFRKKDVIDNFIVKIPNDDFLNSEINGAGNDLLLFLNIALQYPKIEVLPFYGSFFRYHNDSFTALKNLSLYYFWSKIYFLEHICQNKLYLDAFKLKLFIYKFKDDRFINIHKHIKRSNLYIYNCIRFVFNFIFK